MHFLLFWRKKNKNRPNNAQKEKVLACSETQGALDVREYRLANRPTLAVHTVYLRIIYYFTLILLHHVKPCQGYEQAVFVLRFLRLCRKLFRYIFLTRLGEGATMAPHKEISSLYSNRMDRVGERD